MLRLPNISQVFATGATFRIPCKASKTLHGFTTPSKGPQELSRTSKSLHVQPRAPMGWFSDVPRACQMPEGIERPCKGFRGFPMVPKGFFKAFQSPPRRAPNGVEDLPGASSGLCPSCGHPTQGCGRCSQVELETIPRDAAGCLAQGHRVP